MKTKTIVPVLLCAAMIVTFSCSKEGPAGPQGEQGIQGVAGTDGEKGDKGDRGTANVIYSDWLGTYFDDPDISGYYTGEISAPEITLDIMNKGEVIVYMRHPRSGLPYIIRKLNYHYGPPGPIEWANAIFGAGIIEIISNYDMDAPSYGFRYIIIPGGVHARLTGGQARSSSARPDMNDYRAVCQYYGIPE